MDQHSLPRHHSDVASQVVDGQAVLVHPGLGKVCALNGVGSRLWELADGTRTIGSMSGVIAMEYQVDEARALVDALAFCQDLARRGMLVLE